MQDGGKKNEEEWKKGLKPWNRADRVRDGIFLSHISRGEIGDEDEEGRGVKNKNPRQKNHRIAKCVSSINSSDVSGAVKIILK